MLLSHVFERFIEKTPFAVMARSFLERPLTPEALEALFEEHADTQYTRENLLVSRRSDGAGRHLGFPSPDAGRPL